jgi:hypothetical protein
MIANGHPDDSSLSTTAQDRWEQTPNIMWGFEETGSKDPFHESHAIPQTYELLTYSDSGALPIEDSSRDEASSEPEDLWRSSIAITSQI